MGSGLRLLPLIGGLIVGALPADRVARRLGAKLTSRPDSSCSPPGSALGSSTTGGLEHGFVAAWMALGGAGIGLAMATASSAALSELTEERSGIGSAVLQASTRLAARSAPRSSAAS